MEGETNCKLAIIIPAYKGEFLTECLACLRNQTDQRFELYICDDYSPADIQGISREALGSRSYFYKRFESNLGGISLAKQWNRCVAVSKEAWVWLFSDDDLMDETCVEAFYRFLESEGEFVDILHFGLWRVDEEGRITEPVTVDLERETWLEFAYGHLMGWRTMSSQNLVFRRSAFEEAGGFLDIPWCWHGDAAAVIAFGKHHGVRRIPGPRVLWRSSRKQITADLSLRARTRKLKAACLFLFWFNIKLEGPREHLFPGDEGAFRRAMDSFLLVEIMSGGCVSAIVNWNLLSRVRSEVCHRSRFALLKYIAMVAVNDTFFVLGSIARRFIGSRANGV